MALGGGASIAQQYMAEGLIDEMEIHIVPFLLGSGARLFDNLQGSELRLESVRTIGTPSVTHVKYRIAK